MEMCPAWCSDSHHNDADGRLDDLRHGVCLDGTLLPLFDADLGAVAMPLLAARLNVDPYSENPNRRVPHVVLELWQGRVMECLSPDDFAAVIRQVRVQCDRLEEIHRRLAAAQADYR